MTTRYFKATNGEFTIFRGSASRVYRSAWIMIDRIRERSEDWSWVPVGEPQPVNQGFSANIGPIGALKAVEIDKAEYDALVQAKKARTSDNAPRASWVRNADLEGRTTA
jgi:hypothetical protein